MYKATVNRNSFQVSLDDSSISVNGMPINWDLIRVSDGFFHVLLANKSYSAEVIRVDKVTKSVILNVNGRIYSVQIKDKFDLLLDELGMNSGKTSKVNHIRAPMPGLIIDLRVKEGDLVKMGDPLLVLEAMKMENILKAPGDGIVKSIKVKRGDSVEKNQVMIEF